MGLPTPRSPARARGVLPQLGCVLVCACGPARAADAPAPKPAIPPAQQAAVAAPEPKRAPFEPVSAGQVARIDAGTLYLGSKPGTVGRNPAREADLSPLELGPFLIDRLPYPNDPGQPALTGLTRDEAARKCRAEGKRLCTEVEWERACKGPNGDRRGITDAAACTQQGEACASGFGVVALGAMAEWTASDVPEGLGGRNRTAVIRGTATTRDLDASEQDSDVEPGSTDGPRCAARAGAVATTASKARGFRCCQGDANEHVYPTETKRPLTRALRLDAEQARTILRQVDGLAEVADSFEPFEDRDVDAALRRGQRSRASIHVWNIQPPSFAWSPTPGEELWVLSGRAGERSVMTVVWPLGEDRFAHAASTIVEEPESSIAIGNSEQYPKQLIWTTCYNCRGEGGIVLYDEESQVRIGYR